MDKRQLPVKITIFIKIQYNDQIKKLIKLHTGDNDDLLK